MRGLFLILLLGCDAASLNDADATLMDATDESETGDLVLGDGGYVPANPNPDVLIPDVLIPAPAVACVDGGADATVCPLPHSVCAGDLLEYFDDGRCVDGGCAFRVNVHECSLQGTCVDGGCVQPHHTAPN